MADRNNPEVVRFYTAARKVPLLFGAYKGKDGEQKSLLGGPYSLTQILVALVATAGAAATQSLWGPLLSDLMITRVIAMLIVGAAAGYGIGYLPQTSRSLLNTVFAVGSLLLRPHVGSYLDKPFHLNKPRFYSGALTIQWNEPLAPLSGPLPASSPPPDPEPRIPVQQMTPPLATVHPSGQTGLARLLAQAQQNDKD